MITTRYYLRGNFALGAWVAQLSEKSEIIAIDIAETPDETWQFLPKVSASLTLVQSQDFNLANLLTQSLDTGKIVSGLPALQPAQGLAAEVYTAISTIPPGSVWTYTEVAQLTNSPAAVRAVGTALAQNPWAILVPCHRVVPKAGGIGKYKWGSALKESLLQREKDHEIISKIEI